MRHKSRLVAVQSLVRAEGRADLYRKALIRCQLLMPLQTVAGIVRVVDHLHIAAADEAAGGEVRVVLQLLIAEVPGLPGSALRQKAFPAEIILQFQMASMHHGIPDGL